MYELIQVGENSYYIQSPAKIGLVRLNERDVCLIDSGNDKEAGKKVRKILETQGWNLTAIYNTHSNGDHIGENRGQVISAERLFETVWQEKYLERNNTVMVHIRRLREKMGEPSRSPRFIKTVWGVGYKID